MRKQPTWKVTLTVVGLNFRWKRDVIEKHMPGWCPFPVELEREPDNPSDPDAIKVMIAGDYKLTKLRGVHFGYLSNRVDDNSGERVGIASLLAPKLDAGAIEGVKFWITDIDPTTNTAELEARFRDVKKPASKRKTRPVKKSSKKA